MNFLENLPTKSKRCYDFNGIVNHGRVSEIDPKRDLSVPPNPTKYESDSPVDDCFPSQKQNDCIESWYEGVREQAIYASRTGMWSDVINGDKTPLVIANIEYVRKEYGGHGLLVTFEMVVYNEKEKLTRPLLRCFSSSELYLPSCPREELRECVSKQRVREFVMPLFAEAVKKGYDECAAQDD